LVVVIPATSEVLPVLRLNDSKRINWPLIGIMQPHGAPESDFAHFSYSDEKVPDGVVGVIGTKQPGIFRRAPFGNRPDAFLAGEYQVGAYITFSYEVVGDGQPRADRGPYGAANGAYGAAGAEHSVSREIGTLPAESRATIQVVDSRRTHLRVIPPDDLEKTLREDIAKALGDEQKMSEEQLKLRPVKLEVVGQKDLIDPEKFLPKSSGFGGAF
jgi:hypothetical protein